MRVLVILGNHSADSFNHALAETVISTLHELGHEPILHDLYAEGFDPVLPPGEEKLPTEALPESIRREMDLLASADGLVFIHPNWWGTPPAILKGWIDRIFRVGFAYRFTPNGPVPLFTEKTVQVFSTSNTPREVELAVYHDPLENFWKNIVFGLTGAKSFERRNFESVILSDESQRHGWLNEAAKITQRRFGS